MSTENILTTAHAPLDSDVVELEPTSHYGGPATEGAPSSHHPGLLVADAVSFSGEITNLKRRRIGAAALYLAGVYTVGSVWNALAGGGEHWVMLILMLVRLGISGLIAWLAFSRIVLSPRQVRGLEYLLFGAQVALLCVGQYVVNIDFVREGGPIELLLHSKNGVIHLIVLMVLYGLFIPNDPKNAAYVIMTMALALAATLTLISLHPDVERAMESVKSGERPMTNAVIILLSACLAIYGAHVLNGLRIELHEAKKFGQYRLGRKIGAGGMGEVYLAEHELLKRPCALKLIRPESGADALALARFEREVQSAARLNHPNTIAIYDYGHTEDGTFYYVMEYLRGLSLSDLVQKHGPLPAGRLIYLMRQVCAGLAQAHGMGIVHRDLKPANIFVAEVGSEFDIAKVLDFGLVKLTRDPNVVELTSDNMVSGTPMFMPPEQATGARDLGPAADIYALGAICYFALTGRPPFTGDSPMAIMIAHARDPVVPPSQIHSDIPSDLERIILRALEKKPEDRFADVKELGKALAACQAAAEWDAEQAERWWHEFDANHQLAPEVESK